MKIYPKPYKLWKSELKTLPKIKYTLNVFLKIFKYWTKWWNYAKSGHTDRISHDYFSQAHNVLLTFCFRQRLHGELL